MNISKETKNGYFRPNRNLNTIIISNHFQQQQTQQTQRSQHGNSKAKQIKFLKRFEEIFKKQYLEKQKKQIKKQEKSQFQFTNRLKGMFILKRRSEFSDTKPNQKQIKIDEDEEDSSRHPVLGKSLGSFYENSPQKQKSSKDKKQVGKKNKQVNKSGKIFTPVMNPIKRPITQLDITRNKVFNYQKIIALIQKANKVTIVLAPTTINFSYFSVYVQDGNNSEMIKAAVRKRSGWRVVQIPSVAHMIWSQFYKVRYDYKTIKKSKDTIQFYDKQITQSHNHSFSKNTQSTLSQLDDTPSMVSRTHKLAQNRKSIEQNINRITLEEYNRQVSKLCPKMQHLKRASMLQIQASNTCCFYNHIPNNHWISDKKNLLHSLKKLYDNEHRNVFTIIPFSIQITLKNLQQDLQQHIKQENFEEYWIIKPGQDSNRGRGIAICKGIEGVIKQLNSRRTKTQEQNSPLKKKIKSQSYIIQKYLTPLLYNGRKFDIRMYMLVTLVNKKIRGYIYEEGYLRTCSRSYTYDNFNKYVHLTNDAIQTRCPQYGKYQQGNKLSWKRFQSWLQQQGHKDFYKKFDKKTQQICMDTLKSVKHKFVREHEKKFLKIKKRQISRNSISNQTEEINQSNKIYFEVFGLDFFIDKDMNIWFIQVNTNPALTTDCSRVVHTLIPKMIDNALTIAVQPYGKASKQSDSYKFQNKFQAIYDDQWQQCIQ